MYYDFIYYRQIVTTGDSDKDNFSLENDNLALILGKIPQGTKVAVVSVVGAFRTGKSFLLNFFLRYLRCALDTDDLSEDWMTMDGKMEVPSIIEAGKVELSSIFNMNIFVLY